jgi:hypothetical protein
MTAYGGIRTMKKTDRRRRADEKYKATDA